MKKLIIMSILSGLFSVGCQAQSVEQDAIKETINGFSKAGDINDAEKLASYLDDNYRIVMNRLFGSSDVTVMSKEVYLQKIKSKEFGGDKRTVVFESIVLNGTSAMAKVSFAGSKMTFVSILTLIQDASGKWKIVSDIPIVK